MIRWIPLALLLVLPTNAWGQAWDYSYPQSELLDWQPIEPVNTSSWPVYDVTCQSAGGCGGGHLPIPSAWGCSTPNLGDSGSDAGALSCMADKAPNRSILYLPGGTYNFKARDLLHIDRSNLVLRCEAPSNTRLRFDFTGLPGNTQHCNTNKGWIRVCANDGPGPDIAWTGGFSHGTSTVTVADASSLQVGDWITLAQDADPSKVTFVDGKGNAHAADGQLYNSSIKQIVAKAGNQLALNSTLKMDFDHRGQRVFKTAKNGMVENVGIENCDLHSSSPDETNLAHTGIHFNEAANSWITGSIVRNFLKRGILIQNASRILVRGNVLRDSTFVGAGPRFIEVRLASESVIENNAFLNGADPVELQDGADGHIVAWNYFPAADSRAVFLHGDYPFGNLVEGNDSESDRSEVDSRWGLNGPSWWYRNRAMVRKGRECQNADGKADGPSCRTDADCSGYGKQKCMDRQGGLTTEFSNHGGNLTLLANSANGIHGRTCGGSTPAANCAHYDQDGGNNGPVWIERNLARSAKFGVEPSTRRIDNQCNLANGSTECVGTNTIAPASWASFRGPASLYYGDTKPIWWCEEACDWGLQNGPGAFGDDVTPGRASSLCPLPAELLAKGQTCTTAAGSSGGNGTGGNPTALAPPVLFD